MKLKIPDFANSSPDEKDLTTHGIHSEISIDTLIFNSLHRSIFSPLDPFESPLTTPPTTPPLSRQASPFDIATTAPLPSALRSIPSPDTTPVPGPSEPSRKRKDPPQNLQPRHKNETDRAKQRARAHANRKRKRTAIKQDALSATPRPRMKHLDSSERATNEVEVDELTVTSTGWQGGSTQRLGPDGKPVTVIGTKGRVPENRPYRLDELCGEGSYEFELIKNKPGITQYITSETSRIMVVSVPPPVNDPTWDPMTKNAAQCCRDWRKECRFTDENGRRGEFDNINVGISIGNGQKEPMVLAHGPQNLEIATRICQHLAFRRIAGWMTVCFSSWAPLLFLYYLYIMTTLLEHHTGLQLPFENAIFAAFALNFGPQTVCLPHRDQKNLLFGWCAITALGNFDYKKGGHLVLWELGVVLEFPPGATIFVPSAVLCHSNTSIAPGEDRFSFTMYTAAGLFRWVEHGFQLEYLYQKSVQAVTNAAQDAGRWARGLSLFSTFSELKTIADTK
ncbi:hypothetical protein V5O48_014736 [Marasmius crinis-equi]|uniref:Uncharacterized protein n=1 Tax=Marasmius crinis-equi TaxID=585013 RepID=A0ABR3EWF8_9AGAR